MQNYSAYAVIIIYGYGDYPIFATARLRFLPENLRCVVLGIDLLDNLGQRALLVENKCTAECADARFAAEFLLAPRAERLQHLGRGVGQEREW